MNNLPFLELQFKPSEAPSADVQKNSPPTLASCSEARLGLGLGLPWTSKEGAVAQGCPFLWHHPACPFHRYYILSKPAPALPPVSLLQEKPPPSTHLKLETEQPSWIFPTSILCTLFGDQLLEFTFKLFLTSHKTV